MRKHALFMWRDPLYIFSPVRVRNEFIKYADAMSPTSTTNNLVRSVRSFACAHKKITHKPVWHRYDRKSVRFGPGTNRVQLRYIVVFCYVVCWLNRDDTFIIKSPQIELWKWDELIARPHAFNDSRNVTSISGVWALRHCSRPAITVIYQLGI